MQLVMMYKQRIDIINMCSKFYVDIFETVKLIEG